MYHVMKRKMSMSCLFGHKSKNIDHPEVSIRRSAIIHKKTFLKCIYTEWYKILIKSLPEQTGAPILELGSGGGFLKDLIDNLITSDILSVPDIDITIDGQHLPFENTSLNGILMLDVLHHLPNAGLFFTEAQRCLNPGGKIVMLEPWVTPWSKLIYKYLHNEKFDSETMKWEFKKGGPLSMANIALPWIIFERDIKKFNDMFQKLRLEKIQIHTPFLYLLSGGFSSRLSLPGRMYPLCRRIEKIFTPWLRYWAMFSTISLVRI